MPKSGQVAVLRYDAAMTIGNNESAIERLSKVSVFDYFKKRKMPAFVEPLIIEWLGLFAAAADVERSRLLDNWKGKNTGVLGWYARKMSGQAVRGMSERDLRSGLLAAAIAAGADLRDELPTIALLYNSARKIGSDPEGLFRATAALVNRIDDDLWLGFVARPRSVEEFGFREGEGPHGFDYLPLLAEDGGPTPF